MKDKQLAQWIEAYAEQRISPDEFASLQQRMLRDAEARSAFRRYMNLYGGLDELALGSSGDLSLIVVRPEKRFSLVPTALLLAATIAFLVVGTARWLRGERSADKLTSVTTDEPTVSGVAIVTRLVDGCFDVEPEADMGDPIAPQRLVLSRGLAQIEFMRGAVVVMSAPCDFEIVSPGEAICHRGKIRVYVPPAASGFIVRAASNEVIDMGTEFAIEVSGNVSEQLVDLHVFDGQVIVRSPSRSDEIFRAGDAVLIDGKRRIRKQPDESAFFNTDAVSERLRAQRQTSFLRWKSASETLRDDPRLIAYYTFEATTKWNRTLHDVAHPDRHDRNGAIVGAQLTRGRWESKHALEFRQPGDRVRLSIPGKFPAISMATWARINSLDRRYNSLLVTDGFQLGCPHWQFAGDGRMIFSLRVRPGEVTKSRFQYFSPTIWQLKNSGKWIHLAVTYDAATGVAKHYFNGKPVSRQQAPQNSRVKFVALGNCEIGNWGVPITKTGQWMVRTLNGAIDEFVIADEVLTDAEILQMYESGKP